MDFLPCFPTDDDANDVFHFFDEGKNGNLSLAELTRKITSVYRERKSISSALQDYSNAVGGLDKTLLFVFSILIFIIWFILAGGNILKDFLPFGTIFVGISFIFQDRASQAPQYP